MFSGAQPGQKAGGALQTASEDLEAERRTSPAPLRLILPLAELVNVIAARRLGGSSPSE